MISPHKHLNLDASLLRVAAIALRELRKRRVIEFEVLRAKVLKYVGPDADLAFLPAVNFLFLMGKIEYHIKNDSIEYKGA